MSEIYILCNSNQCLEEITSGRFPELYKADIFTCNQSYSFFRTSGRHLNFMMDTDNIIRYVLFLEPLHKDYQKKIEFIFSIWNMKQLNGNLLYRQLKYSPVQFGGSSALCALAHLSVVENYDTIYLVGYTFDESANKKLWNLILSNYAQQDLRTAVHKFIRK